MRCLIVLSLVSTVLSHSPLHKRHSSIKARIIEERAVEALNFDADAIFPPPLLEKRGLLGGLLDGVGNIVNTVVTDLAPPTTTATTLAPGPTTTPSGGAGTSSNAQGETPAQSTPVTNSPNSPALPAASPTPSAGAGNTNPSNGNTSAGPAAGPAVASSGVIGVTNNDLHATPTPQVVTDHNGNLLTITGPVTRTWLTTFPNGVVSTVTEVLTPTVEVPGEAPPISMEPAKIAAIAGTIATVFLVTFAVALVFLMMRKRQKRRIALLDSRPNSIASFGSVSDEFNGERRVSYAAIVPNASTASFVTAPAYFDGTQMDFPLPPVPAAESRPVSSRSDATFDFSQYRKSRGSIIEDRNRFRKIGQYPDADSYTPFVLPPSEFSHSEGVSGGTPRASTIIDHDQSLGASSSGSYSTSSNPALLTTDENPFIDPVTVPQAIHTPIDGGNLLANSAARRSTLWRTSTFGPDSTTPSARRPLRVQSTSRNTMASAVSSEYGTAPDHDETDSNVPLSRHPSTSTDHYSYHSAFEAYVRSGSPQASASENPFVDQPLPAAPTHMSTPHLTYPALRPNTGTSSGATSVISSVGNESGELEGTRTPDPRDLFYSERSQAFNGRISEESRATGDGASTPRGTHVVYPALRDSTTRGNSP